MFSIWVEGVKEKKHDGSDVGMSGWNNKTAGFGTYSSGSCAGYPDYRSGLLSPPFRNPWPLRYISFGLPLFFYKPEELQWDGEGGIFFSFYSSRCIASARWQMYRCAIMTHPRFILGNFGLRNVLRAPRITLFWKVCWNVYSSFYYKKKTISRWCRKSQSERKNVHGNMALIKWTYTILGWES